MLKRLKRRYKSQPFGIIKDLTNRNLNTTKLGSSQYERFCGTNILGNEAQSFQRLVKEFNI